jgi:hypothetical protein
MNAYSSEEKWPKLMSAYEAWEAGWRPTARLRWCMTEVPMPGQDLTGRLLPIPLLQQLWASEQHGSERWIDVPLVQPSMEEKQVSVEEQDG